MSMACAAMCACVRVCGGGIVHGEWTVRVAAGLRSMRGARGASKVRRAPVAPVNVREMCHVSLLWMMIVRRCLDAL